MQFSRIETNATNLIANTGGSGAVTLADTANTVNLGASTSGANFALTASANNATINIAGALSAGSATLQGTTGNTTINLGASISATSSATLAANGSGSIKETGGILQAATAIMTSGSGNIGTSAAPMQVAAPNLQVTTTGSSYVTDSQSVTVGSAFSGSTFSLTANGSLTTTAAITSSTLTLQTSAASNGSIVLGASVGVAGGTTTISAGGSGSISQTAGTVLGATIALSSGTGSIGSSGSPLQTNSTSSMTANTGGSGSIYIYDAGSTSLQASSAGAIFQLTSGSGPLTVQGAVSAPSVTLSTGTSSNGAIVVNAAVGQSGGNVTIAADGSGSITEGGGGTTTGANVALQSGTGNIGSGPGLNTAATSTLSSNTGGSGITILNNTGAGVTVSGTSGGAYTLTNSGSMTVGNITTNSPIASSSGTITITSTTGQLLIAPGASIMSNGGDIAIANQDTGPHSTATIEIGTNANLHADSTVSGVGNVDITMGNVPGHPTVGATPANVSITANGGGQVYFGSTGISTVAPSNALNALGRNIVFNVGGHLTSTAILLDGGVTITADPPAGAVSIQAPQIQSAIAPSAIMPSAHSSATQQSSAAISMPAQNATNAGSINRIPRPTVQESIMDAVQQIPTTDSQTRSMIDDGTTFNPEDIVMFDGKRLRADLRGRSNTNTAGTPVDSIAEYTPISFISPARIAQPNFSDMPNDKVNPEAPQMSAKWLKAQGLDANHGNRPDTFCLRKGTMLFKPASKLLVETPMGKVAIKAGAVALVVASNRGVAVYDLHDAHLGDIVFTGAAGSVSLSPGRHVMLANSNRMPYEQLNPLAVITHRSIKATNSRQINSEFSITSALNGLRLFEQLKHSTNPADQKLFKQLMKNAAIIMQTSGKSGPYSRAAAAPSTVLMVKN